VQVKAFKNQYVYLGYYFGKTLPIKDSVKLNNLGVGTFTGKDKLPGGIYLLGYPNKKEFVELLIDKNQRFSVSIDSPEAKKGITIKNSAEGLQFQGYQNYMEAKGKEVNALDKLPQATDADKKILANKRKGINDAVNKYRENIITKAPQSLLSVVFNLLKEPIVPEASKHPSGKYDSTYAWYFYKSNYWKGVNFADERLLRTPVYETKFDNYFKTIVYPVIDSLNKEVDKVLVESLPNEEMFKYNCSKLIQRYVNPEYMGQDAVFVHIFEKYIATGMTKWFDEKQNKFIFDRAYSLMENKLGDKAPALDLIDTSGNTVSLYNLSGKYTVVCFWDATCGHCKEVVPRLDSIYLAKWKAMGVTLLGVMTDGGLDNWKKYIVENRFTSWIHAYQPEEQRKKDNEAGRPNFRQLYDVAQTPRLYLLDKDKRIIAKQLTFEQIDDLLTRNIASK
jgi:peroxiredoxin